MNVIITGPPRSGTTLVCHLLNRLPDTVALHEPIRFASLSRGAEPGRLVDEIDRFISDARAGLLADGRAISSHVDGRVPDDPIDRGEGGGRFSWRRFLRHLPTRLATGRRLRRIRAERGWVRFDRPLSENFLLAVKHNAEFTALLPELARRHACFAVVRNPLAVLASWNSIEFAPGRGRAWAAERVDPALRRALDRLSDRHARQLFLLDWSFERYATLLAPDHVIRYEELITTDGRILERITPAAGRLDVPIENRNTNPLYDHALMRRLGERLLASDGAYWHFYDRDEVEALLARLGGDSAC